MTIEMGPGNIKILMHSQDQLADLIQIRWPRASILFRPARLLVRPGPFESVSSINFNYRVTRRHDGFIFHDMVTDEKYMGAAECLINTPLGKEMDVLETEVDSYVMMVRLGDGRLPGALLAQCFNAKRSGNSIRMSSKPGNIYWDVTVSCYYDRADNIIVAEKFIAEQIKSRVRAAIHTLLPQPIAEEIEEYF